MSILLPIGNIFCVDWLCKAGEWRSQAPPFVQHNSRLEPLLGGSSMNDLSVVNQEIKTTALTEDQTEGLKKLREKFDASLIGKLPKPSKTQTDAVKKDFRKEIS